MRSRGHVSPALPTVVPILSFPTLVGYIYYFVSKTCQMSQKLGLLFLACPKVKKSHALLPCQYALLCLFWSSVWRLLHKTTCMIALDIAVCIGPSLLATTKLFSTLCVHFICFNDFALGSFGHSHLGEMLQLKLFCSWVSVAFW